MHMNAFIEERARLVRLLACDRAQLSLKARRRVELSWHRQPDRRGRSYRNIPSAKMLACPESQQDFWWHGSG